MSCPHIGLDVHSGQVGVHEGEIARPIEIKMDNRFVPLLISTRLKAN